MSAARRIIDAPQGSEAWHQHRLTHRGASEAAAMLGMSLNIRRSELLRMKHTGMAREFSDWLQRNVLEKGHEVEALARPLVEAIIGEELYPCTYADGLLSASCDGITLSEEVAFEHKQYSSYLFQTVSLGVVPDHHMPQCQQVLMVTGAQKLIFVVSDGTPERMAYAWVTPDPVWFQRLRDGWAQFEKDLAAYTLSEPAAPAPVGKAPDTLPALRIEVTGQVTASNLAEFKQTALAAIRSVNKDLRTDADFADADKAVKWCADVEARLKAAKEHALSQTASIDELFKALDDIAAESKAVRLDLAKVIDRRKVEVKEQAVAAARRALDAHIATLQAELAPMRLQPVAADFAGAIKGLRSIASMQDALDSTLATAKIAADNQARGIRQNMYAFKLVAEGLEFLFPDLGHLVHKAADDFAAVIGARITQHRADEAAKEEKRRAAEAERIAAAEAKVRADEAARIVREQAAAATPAPAPVAAVPQMAAQAPAPVFANSASAERADEPATLKLGDINALFGPGFTMTAAFVSEVLRVQHSATDKSAKLYRPSDLPLICAALQELAGRVAAGELAEVA